MSRNFLVLKFCRDAEFKISAPRNKMKFWYFTQWVSLNFLIQILISLDFLFFLVTWATVTRCSNVKIMHFPSSLFITIISGSLATVKWSHWKISYSRDLYPRLLPLHLQGNANTNSLLFLVSYFRIDANAPALQCFHAFVYILFEPSFCTHWLWDVQFRLSLHTSYKVVALLICQYGA